VSDDKKAPENDSQSPWYALSRYMGIGIEVSVAIVLCMYGGYELDRKTGHSPLFLVIGLAVGFAVVINILLYYSRAAEKEATRDRKK